ncbi:TPA: DUF551 domain-containing protein [Enterobacter kobei]|nr:DUF551 domain-containing protein [Enterobacter kobei]
MSTITREQLRERAREKVKSLEFSITQTAFADSRAELEEELELARIALASLEAEAVAWRYFQETPADGGYWILNDYKPNCSGVEPLYTAPPTPVSVPECFMRLLHHAYGMTMGHDWNKGTMAGHHREKLCRTVDECRAAMLQGADGNSQVMNDYPETLPCPVSLEPGLKLGKGVATKILLEALQSRANYSAEIEVIKEVCRDIKDGDFLAAAKINSSSELVTTAYKLPKPIKDHRLNSGPDADDYYAGYQAGWNDSIGEAVICNSPVIPDGWVACSEQMPEQFKAILAFNEYGEVWSGAYDRYWNFYCDNLLVEHVTHWMPLPAAPQQEA